jgi:hypothetical protein
MMRGVAACGGSFIRVPAAWGSVTGSPSPATSATQTLTIVSGPRDVLFNRTDTGTVNAQYQKNGGAWTSLTDGLTVSFATTDTLAMRVSGATPGDFSTITTKDNATGASFGGTFIGEIG